MKKPLETKDAAKLLDISPERVRQLEREGTIRADRTASGTRLYDVDEVKQLAKERAAKKSGR